MTQFTRKKSPNDDITAHLKAFQFQDYPVEIKGSSMLKHTKYFGDYDLYSYIGKAHHFHTHLSDKATIDEIYDAFSNIFNELSHVPHMYFVGFKIGDNQSNFTEISKPEELTSRTFIKMFKKYHPVDYVQLDYITYVNDRFIAMTSDYYFRKTTTETRLMNDLQGAIESNINKGNYYKVLKRIFNMFQVRYDNGKKFDTKKLEMICDFFNSSVGNEAVTSSNLKALSTISKLYKNDKEVRELVMKNLIKLGFPKSMKVEKMEAKAKQLDDNINEKSRKIYFDILQ